MVSRARDTFNSPKRKKGWEIFINQGCKDLYGAMLEAGLSPRSAANAAQAIQKTDIYRTTVEVQSSDDYLQSLKAGDSVEAVIFRRLEEVYDKAEDQDNLRMMLDTIKEFRNTYKEFYSNAGRGDTPPAKYIQSKISEVEQRFEDITKNKLTLDNVEIPDS